MWLLTTSGFHPSGDQPRRMSNGMTLREWLDDMTRAMVANINKEPIAPPPPAGPPLRPSA